MTKKQVEPILKEVKAKNITLASIKKEAKNANTMETYELDDLTQVSFYPIFSLRKIRDLQNELMALYVEANESDVHINDEHLTSMTMALIVKHFTHLKSSFPKDVKKFLAVTNDLIDTGFMEIMFEEIFMKAEVEKVFTQIGKQIATSQFYDKMEKTVLQATEDLEIKNKENIEALKSVTNKD